MLFFHHYSLWVHISWSIYCIPSIQQTCNTHARILECPEIKHEDSPAFKKDLEGRQRWQQWHSDAALKGPTSVASKAPLSSLPGLPLVQRLMWTQSMLFTQWVQLSYAMQIISRFGQMVNPLVVYFNTCKSRNGNKWWELASFQHMLIGCVNQTCVMKEKQLLLIGESFFQLSRS